MTQSVKPITAPVKNMRNRKPTKCKNCKKRLEKIEDSQYFVCCPNCGYIPMQEDTENQFGLRISVDFKGRYPLI